MNIEKLGIKTDLPALSFDYEGLKSWAKDIADRYDGLVVQEDDIAGIKSEMAGLNKLKKKLDDARKETVRQVSVPIKEFEGQIKEVCGIFTDTYAFLGDQVKAFEERAREEKRQQVQFLIDATKNEHQMQDMDIPIEPSWLNKSKPMKAVKAEVEAIILAQIKAERERRELEQAKKDRAASIEQICATLSKSHGFTIQPSQFLRLHDLSIPLEEVNTQIANAYEARAKTEASKSQQTPVQQPPAERPAAPAPTSPTTSHTKEDRQHTVLLEVTYSDSQAGEVEAAMRSLQAVAKSAKIINPGQQAAA